MTTPQIENLIGRRQTKRAIRAARTYEHPLQNNNVAIFTVLMTT